MLSWQRYEEATIALYILNWLKKALPSAWRFDVWKCDSLVTAHSRRCVYIIGHSGLTPLQHQPSFPRMSWASILFNGLPSAREKDMSKWILRKLTKYIKLSERSIQDPSLSGCFACFSIDTLRAFSQMRLDDASPCLTCKHPYFVVSLGERGGNTPRICRSRAELCKLQGVCPSTIPAGMKVHQLRRALAHAMTVPNVGSAMNAAMIAANVAGSCTQKSCKRKRTI